LAVETGLPKEFLLDVADESWPMTRDRLHSFCSSITRLLASMTVRVYLRTSRS
jgi:hypothetical protein